MQKHKAPRKAKEQQSSESGALLGELQFQRLHGRVDDAATSPERSRSGKTGIAGPGGHGQRGHVEYEAIPVRIGSIN